MRPQLICFALTSTALILSGCSSARSISNPFQGTFGTASSGSESSEYDRDPPQIQQSPRLASEPAPVPPARGISLSRIIDAAPAGFRRAIGCGDSCAAEGCPHTSCSDDSCSDEGCSEAGCSAKPKCLLNFDFFKKKRLSCFQKFCPSPCGEATACTDVDSCTQELNSCAAPSGHCCPQGNQPPVSNYDAEIYPHLAPSLGGRQPDNEVEQSPQQNNNSPETTPDAPGMVPDVPVAPIGQARPLYPQAWKSRPLFGMVQKTNQNRKSPIHLQPPVWHHQGQPLIDATKGQTLLSLSDTQTQAPSFDDGSDADTGISIQPLIRVAAPTTNDVLVIEGSGDSNQ